jgi:hypothetical protein
MEFSCERDYLGGKVAFGYGFPVDGKRDDTR